MRNIYVDMDDVVADFKGYAYSVLRLPKPKERYEETEWMKLRDNPRLYRDLALKDGATELMQYLNLYALKNREVTLAFLTAIPRKNDVPYSFYDKVYWANRHFPGIPVLFGPYSHDKHVHCKSSNDILIDDRSVNISDWEIAGGLAHRYTDWPTCKTWLDHILLAS